MPAQNIYTVCQHCQKATHSKGLVFDSVHQEIWLKDKRLYLSFIPYTIIKALSDEYPDLVPRTELLDILRKATRNEAMTLQHINYNIVRLNITIREVKFPIKVVREYGKGARLVFTSGMKL